MKRTTFAGLAGAAGLILLTAAGLVAAEEAKKEQAATTPATGGSWHANVAADASATTLDEKQTAVIKAVSGYFNELEHLKGSFVQTGPDNKKLKGKFYIKRPGRFRFDYALPSKQIIISDGEYLAIQDLDLNNEDRIALDQTPFRLLMRKDVDLIRDAKIVEAQEADDLIILSVQDKSPDTPGRIKLFLAKKPALELKEWVTTDAQGLDTRIEVADLNKADEIDSGLFKIQAVGLTRDKP